MQAPTEKTVMKDTFAKAGLPAEVEVYAAMHGWCPPDSGVYNEALAEKAWSRLLVLYGKALAEPISDRWVYPPGACPPRPWQAFTLPAKIVCDDCEEDKAEESSNQSPRMVC